MSVYERLKRMHAWLLPGACTLCAEAPAKEGDFCTGCERALPGLGACCPRCAVPLDGLQDEVTLPCGQCQQHPPRYLSVHAPFRYAPPIDRLVQGAKYSGRLDWLAVLGRRLADHVRPRASAVDAVVPVPLHRLRLRERGYNQSLELARLTVDRLGLPLTLGLERTRPTPPQASLPRAQRSQNVRGAFAANGEFSNLRLALIDDVMTSGATVGAATRCLLDAGAASVEVWVVART